MNGIAQRLAHSPAPAVSPATSARLSRQLKRFLAEHRAYRLEARKVGPAEALDSFPYKELGDAETKLARLIRLALPLPDEATQYGPMPARCDRAVWIDGTLYALIEADDDLGFDRSICPIVSRAVGRADGAQDA